MLLVHLAAEGGRLSYQSLVDEFWERAADLGLRLPNEVVPSGQAFSAARQKLKADLIRRLLGSVSNEVSSSMGEAGLWRGHRVFAVDGSKVSVQRSDELRVAYGTPSRGHCPQMLVSTVFDVMTACPHDVSVAPHATSERTELLGMLDGIPRGSVIVLDRGYPSFEVMHEIRRRGLHFLIRVPSDLFAVVRQFIQYEGNNEVVTIEPPSGKSHIGGAIKVRAIYFGKNGADPTVLMTDLIGSAYPTKSIGELYSMRWQVEEFYKLENASVFSIGQCRSKSQNGVEQEVFAFALFVGLSRHLAVEAAAKSKVSVHAIARKSCMLALPRCLAIAVLMHDHVRAHRKIDITVDVLSKRRTPKRPGRSFPRVSLKPRKRWHAKGKL